MPTPSDQEKTHDSHEQRGNIKLLATCGLTHAALASGGVLPAICLVQIAAQFHLNDARSGLIFAVGPTVTMLTLPIVGLLGERWGKRSLLIAGLCLLAIGLWLIRSSGDFSMLLMGAATLGLSSAVIDALVSPLVMDICPIRTAPVMNLIHACFQIGLVVTAISGGMYLAYLGDWRDTFWPVIVLSIALASAYAIIQFPPPLERGSPAGVMNLLRQKPFWLCAVVIAVSGGVEAGVISWVPTFLQRQFDMTVAEDLLTHQFGLVDPKPLIGSLGLALFAGPMVLGRWFYGSIAEHYGHLATLFVSCLISAIALVALGQAETASFSILCLMLLGLALSGMWPTILTYAGDTIHTSLPTLFSLMAMAGLLGVSVCSWAIGQMADRYGLQAGLSALVVPVLASMAALLVLSKIVRSSGE
ncbi:MAG: MFS transporter [Pirellulales bacterium]